MLHPLIKRVLWIGHLCRDEWLMVDERDIKRIGLAFACLLLGAVGIGFAPIFVRISDVGPVSSAFWRIALSIPVLLLWLSVRGRRNPGRNRPWLLVVCGLFFAADLAFWHWSITLTTVANATLLANLNPVFVALAGYVLFKERFSGLFLIGLAGAMAGAVTLMGSSLEFAPDRLPGDILGVVTATMYAGYFITAARLRSHYGAVEVLLFTAFVTALALMPMALLSEDNFFPESLKGWWILIGLALICQVIGQGLIVYALAHLPAAFSALSLLVQPIVASLAAWVLFDEALGLLEMGGAFLVLCGIVLARKGMQPRKKPPPLPETAAL